MCCLRGIQRLSTGNPPFHLAVDTLGFPEVLTQDCGTFLGLRVELANLSEVCAAIGGCCDASKAIENLDMVA